MAAITLDIGGNTRRLDKDIQKTVSRVYSINLKTKGDQPLGRITGQVNEFTKSLDASNARVIAFGASAGVIFGVQRAFSALVSSTIEVQKSLQDINVILNVSAQNLQKFGSELFNIAKNTGQSFQAVATAATEFSRQGLGVEETLKRTNEALILSRLSGLDTAKSVEALTAAVNSFASQAVTATEVVNKFANVDAAFAVSSADLAEALARVGSSAAQSGVSLNELIAIVTSAQQTTARGGAVIGNSFKTIFTRLQRGRVVDLLGTLGISETDSSGQLKSTIQLLQDLGKVYDTLGARQQAAVAEQVGGVFQINILKAALADLGKEYSIYSSALNVAAGTTDQAIRRNEELNKTYAAQLNALQENARQLAAAGGERLFGPSIDRLVGGTNTLLSGFSESDGQGVGAILGKGILDGLGQFIAGPGIALIGGVLLKLFRDLAKFATGSVQQLLGLNTAATQQRDLQTSIQQILSKNPQLIELALKGEQGLNTAANTLLASLQKQTVELQKQAQVAQQISKAFIAQAGVRVAGGVPVIPTGKTPKPGKASGYIPNFANLSSGVTPGDAMAEVIGAANNNYKIQPKDVYKTRIYDGEGGSFISNVNKKEDVTTKTVDGVKGTFVVPPTGFAAKGFVPNFAEKINKTYGPGVIKGPQSSQIADQNLDRYTQFSLDTNTISSKSVLNNKFYKELNNLNSSDPIVSEKAARFLERNGVKRNEIFQLKQNLLSNKKNVPSLLSNNKLVKQTRQVSGVKNNVLGKSLFEKLAARRLGLVRNQDPNSRIDLTDKKGNPVAEVKYGKIGEDNIVSKVIESTYGRNRFKDNRPETIGMPSRYKLIIPGLASGFVPNFAKASSQKAPPVQLGNLDKIPNKLGNKVLSLIYPGLSEGYTLKPATASYLKKQYTGNIPVAGISQKKLQSQLPDIDKNIGDLLVREANQFGQALGGFNFLKSPNELPNYGAAKSAVGVAFEGGVGTLLRQKVGKQNAGIDFRNITPRLRSIFNNAPGIYDAKRSPELTNEVLQKLLNETKPGATVQKTSGVAGAAYLKQRSAAVEQLRKEGITGSVAIRQALKDRFGIVGKAAGFIPNFANIGAIQNLISRGATEGERQAARSALNRVQYSALTKLGSSDKLIKFRELLYGSKSGGGLNLDAIKSKNLNYGPLVQSAKSLGLTNKDLQLLASNPLAVQQLRAFDAKIQNAINNERNAGIPKNKIYLAREKALTSANPIGLGVFNKRDEPTKKARKSAMRNKGFASGYIPNFAIEDPDVQGASAGTATAAIISQITGIGFAFAFTGNQFKDSLKELTEANKLAGKVTNQAAKAQQDAVNQIYGPLTREQTRIKESDAPFAPRGGQKTGAFLRSNALGLSIAAPVLGETIKNVAGQETPGARQFGEVASGAGQIASFGATGALIAKGGGPIGLAIGALLTIPSVVNAFTTELPELTAAAKKASQDLTKFSDASQRILTASSSLSEFTDKGASPEKLKKVQDNLAKALSELTPAERSRIESSIRIGNLEEELAKITQERIDQEKLRAQAVSVRAIAEKGITRFSTTFDPTTAEGQLDEETIRSVFKGFFTGKTPEETLENFNKAAKSGVPQLQNLAQAVEELEKRTVFGAFGAESLSLQGGFGENNYLQNLTNILEESIPQGKTADQQEARSRFIKDLLDIASNDITNFKNIVQVPLKALTRDAQAFADGAKSAEIAAKNTALFNQVKEKYSGIIENSISSLNRTISVFNSLASALDQFQVSAQSFAREQGVAQGFTLPKNVAETVLGPEAELTRRAALFEKIAQNETARLDAIDKSNLSFREDFRGNLNEIFTGRLNEIQTLKGTDARTIPEQAALAEEILKAQKLFESGAININQILEDSFKDGAIDSDKFGVDLRAAFEKADFKSSETEKILDGILKVSEQQNANLLSINQNAKQQNVRAAQEFTNEKILLDISRSLKVFGGVQSFLQPSEEGIVKPLQTLIQSATGQLKAQRDFEFGKRTGSLTSLGTEKQVQNNIGLGQSALNFINQLKDISGGVFAPDPGSELYNRAVAGLTQSFESNIKKLNDVLKDPNVDQAFKSQIKATLDAIGSLGSGREISQLQVAQETGSAFQSTLEGTLSRLQDPAIQQLRDANLPDLANEIARSSQYTANPIVNALNVQKSIQTNITKQLEDIKKLLPKLIPKQDLSIAVQPGQGDVQTNARGYIPAFNKERQAISRGVGGARAGDRPQFIPNLNGSPAFVNSGERLVDNYGGSGQTAVLTREMQNAMVAAKGFIPNFAGQRIVTLDDIPKEESFKTIQGKIVQDQTDTGKNYVVIRSKTPLNPDIVGTKISFGKGKKLGEVLSIDPFDVFSARVGNFIGEQGSLLPVKDTQFITKLQTKQKQDLPAQEFQKKLDKYTQQYEEAFRFTIPGNGEGTFGDSADILRNLQREFQFNSQNYNNIDNNPTYRRIKQSVQELRDKIRSTNPTVPERSQDPEFLKFLEEQKNKPRGVGPATTIQDQIAEAVAGSATGDAVARATATNPENLLTDVTKRAAQVTATIGKYTGLNIGSDEPFGSAKENPVVKFIPKKGKAAAGTTDNEVRYYQFPGVGIVFNEATHLNQNVPGKFNSTRERSEIAKSIEDGGGIQNYLKRLKKLADFLEKQNKTASKGQKFTFIAGTVESLSGKYSDTRAFSSGGEIVSSEFQHSENDPLYIQERASTLNDFLSRGIVSGAITAEEMGELGIPLEEAKNIVAETLVIDEQLKRKKPQPSRPVTPPPAVPGVPATEATVPPPKVEELPSKPKPKPKPVTPPPAVPGIPTAVPEPKPAIPKAATGYPGGISPETARAIVQELDATYNNAISKQRNPQIAKSWAQTQQRYRLLYSSGKYAELDAFYKQLRKGPGYNQNYGQGTGRPGESVQNLAMGFIPNFSRLGMPHRDPKGRAGVTWGGISSSSGSSLGTPHRDPKGRAGVTWGGISRDLKNIASRIEKEAPNYASGFIPNFAKDYISNLAELEAGLSGEDPAMGYDKKIGPFMYNKAQSRSGNLNEIIAKDHPEGLKAAMKNSMKMQKSVGVMNKGFVPNFAATDQSFTQLESSFSANTSALTSLAGGIESLNSTLSNFEANFANLNNVPGTQPAAGVQQAGAQPNVTTTTNAPVNVVVNAEGGGDIAAAVGQAVQNAIPTIIDKVKIALGQKVPPTTPI